MNTKDFRFTENWFEDVAKPVWETLFEQITKPKRILEVGCYEGRATTWLCENILEDGAEYDIVDTFEGSEESGMQATKEGLANNASQIENNFRHNISFYPNIKFNIHKGFSQKVLSTLPPVPTYDFIYIDASHRADDTFVDSYFANKLLKPGGVIIFDDFRWKDPQNMHPRNSPEFGIRAFCTMYGDQYTVLFEGYQLGLSKIAI